MACVLMAVRDASSSASASFRICSSAALNCDGVGTFPGYIQEEPYYDIKNVEVLRGPQGTIVGQNSTGGAVFVTTNDPQIDGGYHGYLQGQVGNYWDIGAQGAINLPISRTLAARFAFYGESRDSFYHIAGPNGLLLHDGRIAVSEAWRHRLLDFPTRERGAPRVLLDDLPGYPGRLSSAPDGGAWLAVFAPRTQLVEFVLREDRYRHWMMQTIEPAHWIAPTLRAGRSYKEPMQGGAVKTLGIFKPWAPSRSYGLAVRLDGDFIPTTSLHSRADGKRHGVTSCLEIRGELIAACKGDDALVSADLAREQEA